MSLRCCYPGQFPQKIHMYTTSRVGGSKHANFYNSSQTKNEWENGITNYQISAKRGPASKFVVEANTKAVMSMSNSRRSKKLMIWGRSIRPRSKYQSEYHNYSTLTHKWSKTRIVWTDSLYFDKYFSYSPKIQVFELVKYWILRGNFYRVIHKYLTKRQILDE